MILLAIKVVLLFTYTTSDLYSLLFYNLINFVCWTVYKNDTPEQILVFSKNNYPFWLATADYSYAYGSAVHRLNYQAKLTNEWAKYTDNTTQRPVLYQKKYIIKNLIIQKDTEELQSYMTIMLVTLKYFACYRGGFYICF